jgi:hypothetical protein
MEEARVGKLANPMPSSVSAKYFGEAELPDPFRMIRRFGA